MLRGAAGRQLQTTIPAVAKERKFMSDQNRVLSRQGARQLTPAETDVIKGGFITLSVCTANPSPDGDRRPFEAGC
jgi:hypothetical protein